ncbi:MAG: radical SAM protein [Methanomassiliicoccales archaeon]|nr:MAG: radical SAM protein [Methanomassiliicoccales archaeon]
MQRATKKKGIRVAEINCKTALSPSRLPGFDYALNPYRGCAHGCKYCYAPNTLRIPRREWGGFIEVRRNIPKVLGGELRKKKKGVVGISTTTDPYQPAEKEYELTRHCLSQLLRYDFPVSILTKSDLVTRDLDLLSRFSEVEIGFTITTDNDGERKQLEPNAPSLESRLASMAECSSQGIVTYAFFGPLYPTINEKGLKELVKKVKGAGATKIMADRLNLKPGVWDSVNNALVTDSTQRSIWKESIFGKDKGYDRLFSFLKKICTELEIDYEMQDY